MISVCAYTISAIMNSQDLPYVVHEDSKTRHDRLNNLLKCSICLNLGKAVITTFIELFTLRKPKLIFNYIKQNVRRYLEFDLV